MFKIIFLIVNVCFFASSCATLINDNQSESKIITYPDSAKLVINYTDTICCTNKTIHYYREDKPLIIEAYSDSLSNTAIIKSSYSLMTYANLAFFPIFPPLVIGFIYDINQDLAYKYDDKIYIDLTNSNYFEKKIADSSLPVNISLSFLYINLYYTSKDIMYRYALHSGGVSGGIEYYLTNKTYISSEIGITAPLFVPIDSIGAVSTSFFNIRYNKVLGSIQLGAGLSYHNYFWYEDSYLSKNKNPGYKYEGPGLSLAAQYHLGKGIYMGLIYQPSFFNLNKNFNFDYQSFINFEFKYKFQIFDNFEI